MKVLFEINKIKHDLFIYKKRINDKSILEIQRQIDKVKEIVDNEIDRRTKIIVNNDNLKGNKTGV